MDPDAINLHNGSREFLNRTSPVRGFGNTRSEQVYVVLFLCLRLLAACISLMGSLCVLKALKRIKQRDLKPRLLLINAMTTDILFCLCMGCVGLVNSLEPLRIIGTNDLSCLRYIANFATPAIQYAQVLSCLLLTLDRVYAVVAPFRYHRRAYPPLLSSTILLLLWATVVGLVVPVFWVPGGFARWKGPCSQMGIGHSAWTVKVRFPLVVGVSLLNFFVYVCLFMYLNCRRDITTSQRVSLFSKQNLSLAFTFFSIQLSVMLLYIPGPLFDIILRAAEIRLSPSVTKRIRYVFILLFTLIPVLNSAILALRIPTIKTEILKMLKRQAPRDTGKAIGIPASGLTRANLSQTDGLAVATISDGKSTTPIENEGKCAK